MAIPRLLCHGHHADVWLLQGVGSLVHGFAAEGAVDAHNAHARARREVVAVLAVADEEHVTGQLPGGDVLGLLLKLQLLLVDVFAAVGKHHEGVALASLLPREPGLRDRKRETASGAISDQVK